MSFSAKSSLGAGAVFVLAVGLWGANRCASWVIAREIRSRGGDQVQIGSLAVRLFPSIRVIAENVNAPDRHISIQRATAETNWTAALARHVREVQLDGLRITVPPRYRDGLHPESKPSASRITADRVIADRAVLEILPKQQGKSPLEFDLYRLTMHGAGADQPMSFETVMKNARPPGEIHSSGKFGPWDFEEPAATPVSGSYSFRDADLGVFKGIAGTLSSNGNYHGVLDHIEVDGSTDTPNFTLLAGAHPVYLTCQFHSIVDGTDGNTYLEPVSGHFGGTTVLARGKVVREDHVGRLVMLDATVEDGRLEDILRLAMKTEQTMTGVISFRAKIVIPPGDGEVAEKLQLDGEFTVGGARFQKLKVQQKVNELSNRGEGEPQKGDGGEVASNFRGRFKLDRGVMTFTGLIFDVPGVHVSLNGTYGLLNESLNLSGTASLQAKLSQTTTGWKSALLKIVEPFFKKKNAGTVLPIHIGGTSRSPSFRLSGP